MAVLLVEGTWEKRAGHCHAGDRFSCDHSRKKTETGKTATVKAKKKENNF
jgi:hypothetical protein